jgi:hypothetical protein
VAISVGSVEVDVVPNTRGIHRRLAQALIPAAEAAGELAGAAAGERFGPAMAEAVSGAVGERIGQQIGQQIASQITSSVRGAMQNGITQGGAAARAAATRMGEQTGSTFARSLQQRLEAAMRSLPDIRLTANSTDADREIYRLRHELQAISDLRIGVDISSADAVAAIDRIRARLAELSASDADIALRVDAAAAVAELAAVQAQVDALDGDTARVDVDTSGAMAAIVQLAVAIGGLAALPAVPVLAAGIGSIAAAGVAAGAGVGALAAVALPAFTGIKGALDAQKQAQDAATTATSRGGQAASQAASRALQMAGAQQALASAHRNAGRQIAQAEQGVSDAVRTAAQNNAAAADQVKQARKSLADAYQQAADRTQAANDRVAQAEQALADAQRTALQAQQDLTQARRDAAMQLEDLSARLADAQLGERDAALTVQEAQKNLQATRAAGSKASLIQQQRAQLAYDQAVQRLKEQQTETRRLQAQKAEADKTGVEGTDIVRSAEERLATARRNVQAQQTGLAKAQKDAARTQIQNQQAIAAAQDKVAAAQRNVAKVQEDGARAVARAQQQVVAAQQSAADSIASAQRQIQSASMSTASGTNTATNAQAKYQAALAKLSPAARQTMGAFLSLRSAFMRWAEALQPAVMPIFTRALVGMKNALPALTPIVLAAARAIKGLQDRFSAEIKSPWWKSLQRDLTRAVGPAITGLGVSFGNVFKGMAGAVDAFLPHVAGFSSAMQGLTARFATWGTSLKGSPAFERFLSYAAEMAPRLGDVLWKIAGALLQVGKALSPISGPLLAVIGAVAEAIGIIAERAPWMIQLLYGVIVAVKLWTLAQIALNLAMSANPLVLIGIAIAALVAAVIYAYNRFAWFRNVVQAAWTGIQAVAVWVWNTVLKPIFTAIWAALQAVGRAAMWLWTNALQPAFNGIAAAATWLWVNILQPAFTAIGAVISWLWTNVVQPVFGFIKLNVQALGFVFSWLYNNIIQPVFSLIAGVFRFFWGVAKAVFGTTVAFIRNVLGPAFSWLYNNIVKPVFGFIVAYVRSTWIGLRIIFSAVVGFLRSTLGPVFSWLYNSVVVPVWNGIRAAISGVWRYGIRPIFDALRAAVHTVAVAFEGAKNAIRMAWNGLIAITKAPVNFVINTVYTHGIKAVWDKVVGAFGGTPLPKVAGLARGGILPGTSTFRQGDDQLVPMRRGEGVYVSEAMRDPYERARLHAVNAAAIRGQSLGPFQGGFALGGIFDGIGDIASGAWDTIKAGASWLADTFGGAIKAGARAIVNPLINLIPGGGGFGGLLKSGAHRMVDQLLGAGKKGDDLATPNINYKAGAGVAQWRPVVLQALREVGQSSNLAGSTLRRMQQESGGNPTIVNKWDSNWQAGHPSVGLMQVIGPTFRSYAGKYRNKGPFSYGVSVNPLANIYSSMKYAMGAYGSLGRAYDRAGGYDSGGYLQPGLNLAYNGTGRPEPVFTTQQANALVSLAGSGGAGGHARFEGDLYLDSGEFLGRVRGEATQIAQAEVRRSNTQLAGVLRAGRRG